MWKWLIEDMRDISRVCDLRYLVYLIDILMILTAGKIRLIVGPLETWKGQKCSEQPFTTADPTLFQQHSDPAVTRVRRKQGTKGACFTITTREECA